MNWIPTPEKAWNTIGRDPQRKSWTLSFRSRGSEHLIVKPDGRVLQGNTRIKVLEERGYPANDLPRETFE
jgi:hypothetical protein